MFDRDKLWRIIGECCVPLRKGEVVEAKQVGNLNVTTINDFPSEDELVGGLSTDVIVDLHFIKVLVDTVIAEKRREEFIEILNQWPEPEVLAGGPSYMTVGGTIGDQGAAFQFFALGAALDIWKVITPATFGATGAQADQLAGSGYIMCSGYTKAG